MAQTSRQERIAIAGKPNAGKSSLFNRLTGLNQKIGNFPGVTVEKRTGTLVLSSGNAVLIDLPGTYSLYARTLDEKVVAEILSNPDNSLYPDKVILLADTTTLKSSLLLLTQIIDLRLPVVLGLNMIDQSSKSGQSIDVKKLSFALDVPVVLLNARAGHGLDELRKVLNEPLRPSSRTIFEIGQEMAPAVNKVRDTLELPSAYQAYHFLQQPDHVPDVNKRQQVLSIASQFGFFAGKYQGAEVILRYTYIQDLLNQVVTTAPDHEWRKSTRQIDRVLTHRVWGYAIFFAILFLIFQAIFAWAQVPMDLIDSGFANLSAWVSSRLPSGPFFELISKGVIPGIGGIVIFIPQIAILFGFIAILEETGYMARVVFLMDKVMSKFGLSGRSVVPLISGWACAIPAIMATRTIQSWKDRLITIFVTPFMSCSARLPVFAILVALTIPDTTFLGFVNLQGLVLFGLYFLGVAAALITAFIMKLLIKTTEKSILIMEMPSYRMPAWKNVGYTVVEKTKTFVFEAGKIILAISIILWVLASYGPGGEMSRATAELERSPSFQRLSPDEQHDLIASTRLEHSYAGVIGRSIEPVIRPLGYDWKIGIALITSFAAREVFVATMATIYSIGSAEDESTIRERLATEINPETGGPRFTTAVGVSLLIFYTFAMQCMSTLAVVRRETQGWKWPMIQLLVMTGLAYVSAFAAYQWLA
jgi:ferrous iron transport protein B